MQVTVVHIYFCASSYSFNYLKITIFITCCTSGQTLRHLTCATANSPQRDCFPNSSVNKMRNLVEVTQMNPHLGHIYHHTTCVDIIDLLLNRNVIWGQFNRKKKKAEELGTRILSILAHQLSASVISYFIFCFNSEKQGKRGINSSITLRLGFCTTTAVSEHMTFDAFLNTSSCKVKNANAKGNLEK